MPRLERHPALDRRARAALRPDHRDAGAFNGDFLPAAKLVGADATLAKAVRLAVFRDTLWAVLQERNQGAASSV
jgi:hypothetical protein